ncbi:MAG: 2-oxoglutarate and iron-dependent oxygenase domain-containing protein [bacterium]|nr:2-oxoglutarate and iron-dependent oxygenase domain-containing protein [bacterium]
MASTETIPVIDLGPYLAGEAGALDRTAQDLRIALTEIGFYFIVNHGVPRAQIREVFRQAALFHAQPLEKKMEIRLDKHNTGYLPMKGDTLRTSTVQTVTKPNLNEALFTARDLPADHPDVRADRRFRGVNRWPDLPGFREIIVGYSDRLERLVQKLVRLYARALDLPAEYFDAPFRDFQYKLRMSHYPPQPGPAEDEFGIAPHTDTSFLTLLASRCRATPAARLPRRRWRRETHGSPGSARSCRCGRARSAAGACARPDACSLCARSGRPRSAPAPSPGERSSCASAGRRPWPRGRPASPASPRQPHAPTPARPP